MREKDVVSFAFTPILDGRDARQRLIEWWDQDRLARARVVVAGAGALGNEALKLLALLGVGSVIVVDFDAIARSNLSRTVLFREGDVDRSKAEVAALRARELNPDISVVAINGDIGRDLGLGTLAQADIVIGGLDNLSARFVLNRRCMLAGVPWLNAGITAMTGQVTRYHPAEGACYECTFSESMAKRMNERYSCTGLVRRTPDGAVPTTAIGASMTAALQINDAVRYLHNPATGLRSGHRLSISLETHRTAIDELPINPYCEAHLTVDPHPVGLSLDPQSLSARALVASQAEVAPNATAVELGFDLIESFECISCGEQEIVGRPASLVFEDESNCPNCGADRSVARVSQIDADSPFWDTPLADLGVASREWLRLTGEGLSHWVGLGGADPWKALLP